MGAKEVAVALAARFLEAGSFTSVGSIGARAAAQMPYGAEWPYSPLAAVAEHGFAGLSVQSVGYEAGRPDEEAAVHVYLTKGSRRAIKSLPDTVDDVRVIIDHMGNLVVRPEAASTTTTTGNVYEKNGRLACGSSCAPGRETMAGTFGALVRDASGGLYALSNNHVFAACNHTPVGMPILSPSTIDAKPGVRAPGEFCRHDQIVELRSGEPFFVPAATVDAALGRIVGPDQICSWQGDDANGFDTPTLTIAPGYGQRVKKFGRTTGLTVGTVESLIPAPTPINYKAKHFTGIVWFMDVWTIKAEAEHFALPGDSGSLVVTDDGTAAVGLLFAASPRGDYGWIIPIERILEEFNGINLVGQHGL
jgi:hypothetical protein